MKRLINGSALCLTILLNAGKLNAQQGMVAAGADGNGPGGSIAISVGQMDYSYYVTDQGSVSFGLQHVWEGTLPPLPINLQIPDQTVSSGQTVCYNALAVITVAGEGNTFVAEPGGSAELIAGQKILLREGTRIENGGYLLARINPEGPWCNQPVRLPESLSIADEAGKPKEPSRSSGLFFRIYPNPTPGDFILELEPGENKEEVMLEVLSLQGCRILQQSLHGELRNTISLAGCQPGMYIIVVHRAHETVISKIVRY